ncbi:MAG: Fur family transcriptional regulator [Myxococcota bacterium]
MVHEPERRVLSEYLEKNQLKRTRQREVILDAFLDQGGHTSSEELHRVIVDQSPGIGYTTVYRTMKLLVEAGLAEERHFNDGLARYEPRDDHHDHLVCTECGAIIEFESEEIESAQTEIAKFHGFTLEKHRHELYGRCPNCQ